MFNHKCTERNNAMDQRICLCVLCDLPAVAGLKMDFFMF